MITYYTRKELDHEARRVVVAVRKNMPACLRRAVKAAGWALRVGAGFPVLVVYFTDQNGRHDINVAI
ncbi:MAG: hypothetical protein IMZ50_04830 [Candidatus Atribacteria bacterium]|nr:hypothetical protein [Candidatus Atribacteria bacterium]